MSFPASNVFEAVDRRDVGMIQRREDVRFPLETGETIRVVRHLRQQHLDRDVAAKLCVACAVDRAHSTFAEERLDVEDTEPGSRGQERGQVARILLLTLGLSYFFGNPGSALISRICRM